MTIVSLLVALVALAVAVLALRRADVVERRAKQWGSRQSVAGSDAKPNGVPATAAAAPRSEDLLALQRRLDALERADTTSGLSRVAVVRYDAFDDLGGRLSFSAAVVDAQGRGLVLTAIHGRTETRSYLKQVPVTPASGQRALSPEEQEAVDQAMRGPTT